ncbi:hypothetical protein EH223_17205 [candidate division KSB1 bacterium]|nr:hypothetical protein [candidate division KSB1 bacterium]RQW00888.1 MAG: hypothetical protein EH223_17205 [candidate division KSB1 bacterium]
MAFLILNQDVDQDGLINDFIYFDEENTDDFVRVIEHYAERVREIRFERSVKIKELQKLNRLFAKFVE